jgi:TonB family protein
MEERQLSFWGDPTDTGDSDAAPAVDSDAVTPPDQPFTDWPPPPAVVDTDDVLPFDGAARDAAEPVSDEVRLGAEDRPAPPAPAAHSWLALFMALSLAAHAGLLVFSDDEPTPLPSIGVVSLSVDLVLGTDLAAGVASAPSPTEAGVSRPQEAAAEPAASADTPTWIEQVLAMPQIATTSAPRPRAEPATEPAETPPRASPVRPTEPNGRQDTAALPGASSSGIGQGASTADASYPAIVAARLARFKQYPTEAHARGDQGTATVTFTLDGDGNVTQIQLAKKSGFASLDRESQAMVRRASPFPPTPTGGPMSFTVPVDFKLR